MPAPLARRSRTKTLRATRAWWKRCNRSGDGAAIGRFPPGVVDNQVEPRRESFQVVGQVPGIVVAVVDPRDQNIFHEQNVAPGQRVVPQGLLESRQVVLPVDRHQTAARLVVGRVQAHRQLELGPVQGRQAPDAVHPPAGGDGDAAFGDIQAALVFQNANGLDHILEIVQGLAHAHEDHIAHVQVPARP